MSLSSPPSPSRSSFAAILITFVVPLFPAASHATTWCPQIAADTHAKKIAEWYNIPAPGARGRKIDLFIGERPAVSAARICVENKSVVTAHRNKTNRLDDLDDVMRGVHGLKPEAIIVATVLIGTARRVLNVPDHVKKRFRKDPEAFERQVVPRLSRGDRSLWDEFDFAVSNNRADDPERTIAALRTLPTRPPGHTHVPGYDFIMLVPVFINNVDPPLIVGIDIDADYQRMQETICRAYEARWHL